MNFVIAKLSGIREKGESLAKIFSYWIPELISITILIYLPPIVDSWIVAQLGSLTIYGAVGMGINFLHLLIKMAEGVPVAAIAIIGRHNGAEEYKKCGEDLGDTFWTTFLIGFIQFAFVFTCAAGIYRWLGVPEDMVLAGTPFLQAKSFGLLLGFCTLGLLSFMRAIKNTRIPMLVNILGIATFMTFDYGLVFGAFGLPEFGFMGSAIATILQNSVMLCIALSYILFNPDYKKYFSKIFFSMFNFKRALHLLNISWPIIIDKSCPAFAYIWLSKELAPIGTHAIATYDVVKNIERFAFLPSHASAAVLTFLVSNYLGSKNYDGAMANIKKLYIIACCITLPTLLFVCVNSSYLASFFDPKNQFTSFAATVLSVISVLVFADFTQVVLAGALRGAGDVRYVMLGRFFAIAGFFVPVSYFLSHLEVSSLTKFILVYGSYYLTTGIMGMAYFYRIKSHKWYEQKV